MNKGWTLGGLALHVVLWASPSVALATEATVTPTRPTSGTLVNAAGQPLLSSSGERLIYSRAAWRAGSRSAKLPAPSEQVASLAKATTSLASASTISPTAASWSWSSLGQGIGLRGLVATSNGDDTEVYVSASTYGNWPNSLWLALKPNRAGTSLSPFFSSQVFDSDMVRLTLATATQSQPKRIVVALKSGRQYEYDQASKALLSAIDGPCVSHGGLRDFIVADVDGDGDPEQVSMCQDDLLVVHQGDNVSWSLPKVGGTSLVVGQMDDDPGLEIATTSGRVIDVTTRQVQWYRSAGFGAQLALADIDGDGRQELISADAWYWIWAYDVERQLPKWSSHTSMNVSALTIADADGDGRAEVLYGDGQWGKIHALDPATGIELGAIDNQRYGVNQMAVVRLGADGLPKIIFGTGDLSSSAEHLHIASWAKKRVLWESLDVTGPFTGPELGDVTGDGVPELVVATGRPSNGQSGGRIVVLSSKTLQPIAISDLIGPTAWNGGIRDLKLRDVDGDGRLDIVVAFDTIYAGTIEAYSLDSQLKFKRIWTNASRPEGSPFTTVEVADVDGDGRPEVLAGSAVWSTTTGGNHVYAYDSVTGAEKWHTMHMPGDSAGVNALIVKDINGDGVLDVLASVSGGGVHAFDGRSQTKLGQLDKPGTSLGLRRNGNLYMGDGTGQFSRLELDADRLYVAGRRPATGTAITGFSDLSGARGFWYGSGGVLRRSDTGRSIQFESLPYGLGTGKRTVGIGQHMIITNSALGLIGFTLN